jgi:hypothetical protein
MALTVFYVPYSLGSGSDVMQFRGGLVFKAHKLLYHSTLNSRIIELIKKSRARI